MDQMNHHRYYLICSCSNKLQKWKFEILQFWPVASRKWKTMSQLGFVWRLSFWLGLSLGPQTRWLHQIWLAFSNTMFLADNFWFPAWYPSCDLKHSTLPSLISASATEPFVFHFLPVVFSFDPDPEFIASATRGPDTELQFYPSLSSCLHHSYIRLVCRRFHLLPVSVFEICRSELSAHLEVVSQICFSARPGPLSVVGYILVAAGIYRSRHDFSVS